MMRAAVLVCLIAAAFAGVANETPFPQSPFKIRAVWARSTGDCKNLLTLMNKHGFNRLYLSVWYGGKARFPSPTLQAIVPQGNEKSVLTTCISNLKSMKLDKKISIVAWFESGTMGPACTVAPSNNVCNLVRGEDEKFHAHLLKNKWIVPGMQSVWPKRDAANPNKEFISHTWLDLGVEGVRKFIMNTITDAAKVAGLAGIQVDDHFGNPLRYADHLKALADYLVVLKKSRPGFVVSYAPAKDFGSAVNFPVSKWRTVAFDEIAPQVYLTPRTNIVNDYKRELGVVKSQAGNLASKVIPIIRHTGSSDADHNKLSDVVEEIKASANQGLLGVGVWKDTFLEKLEASGADANALRAVFFPSANANSNRAGRFRSRLAHIIQEAAELETMLA